MAGIYVHIPFCKQACIYCDFHFSTSTRHRSAMATAIAQEARLRRNYLGGETVGTLYFGGGTPSLLEAHELQEILQQLRSLFNFSSDLEFTFEANPDDLSAAKLAEMKDAGVNRLSIGLQALDDAMLQWMNRAHRADEGLAAVRRAQAAGIDNISVDLIYGRPGLNSEAWKQEIKTIIELGVPHISAYCLTVEPGTVLGKRVSRREEKPMDEQAAGNQFEILISELAKAGIEQYEVSNFAKPGFYSRHNTAYWQGTAYLGLGPSAHSFDGAQRSWNVANNARYIKSINEEKLPVTIEEAAKYDRLNEWIMTGLRTKWGIDLMAAKAKFGVDLSKKHAAYIATLEAEGLARMDGNVLSLNPSGLFRADGIASDFFEV